MNCRELIARVEVAPRQLRYMISEGFVPPPTGGRAHAVYGEEHLKAAQRYVRLRKLGFTPASIKVLQQAHEGAPFPVVPGITLVVDPQLIASGEPVEPMLSRVEALLREIFENQAEP